jgi:hypothetical protein
MTRAVVVKFEKEVVVEVEVLPRTSSLLIALLNKHQLLSIHHECSGQANAGE